MQILIVSLLVASHNCNFFSLNSLESSPLHQSSPRLLLYLSTDIFPLALLIHLGSLLLRQKYSPLIHTSTRVPRSINRRISLDSIQRELTERPKTTTKNELYIHSNLSNFRVCPTAMNHQRLLVIN